MRKPVASAHRPGRAEPAPSAEVRRVRDLYLRELRTRLEDGSYLTSRRVDLALDRLLRAVRDDLPQDP
jgi:hypothetical protein